VTSKTAPKKIDVPKKTAVDPKKVFKLPKAGQGTPTTHKPAKLGAKGFKLESSTVPVDPHRHKTG
jgi:hypothetical protein